jgi:predicted dehydrogenase
MKVRIAVAGAGLIGRRHIEEVAASSVGEMAAIVDPGPAGVDLVHKYGVALYLSLREAVKHERPDGVILATPNRMHVAAGRGGGSRPASRCSPGTIGSTAQS